MSRGMVISRLFGGAGNQLFQYAAARALADHLGCDLALDARYLPGLSHSGDCFDHFAKARFIADAMWTKQAGHAIGSSGFAPPARTMSAIGG